MNLALQAAEINTKVPPLTPEEKKQWNGFVDFLDKAGLKGSPMLDNRNTAMGAKLMEEYRKANPSFSLTYDRVKDVQGDLQTYRADMVDKFKNGKIVVEGVKSEEEIMPGLSSVDGWLGSKTSSWKFPTALLTESSGANKNFGVDISAYEAATQNLRKNK